MGRNAQKFIFSKGGNRVIVPYNAQSRAIEIESNGRGRALRYNGINSRWW